MWRGPAPTDMRSFSVFMDQNNKCNLSCRMCGFSDPRVQSLATYDMPRWLFDRIVAEVFPRAGYVCLSLMTEPFMTRDFPDRLAAVAGAGVPFFELITNGTLLSLQACEKIVAARVSRVIFSIDGGTKAVFEAIRTGARFERVVDNFRMLRAIRDHSVDSAPVLRINHVLSELNIDEFDNFLDLASDLHPEEIAVRTVSRMSDAAIQESHDPIFWAKVTRASARLQQFCLETGIHDSAYLRKRHTQIDLFTDSGEKMSCSRPWDTLAIHPNGDVYPCMAWSRPPIGNLVYDRFEDILSGDALGAIRDEFRQQQPGVDCLNCTIRRAENDPDDDFFYRKLAKAAPPATAPERSRLA
jgi:radical SAM protein with 4Fe4S-binding SPASM domain